jgi:hypothetical protein
MLGALQLIPPYPATEAKTTIREIGQSVAVAAVGYNMVWSRNDQPADGTTLLALHRDLCG